MIEAGLFQILTQDSRLAPLIGKRAFYQDLPENCQLPAVVYSCVTSESEFTLDGPDPLTAKHWQFDSYGTQPMEARTVSSTVRNIIEGFSGGLPDGTQVQSVIVGLDIDLGRETGVGPSGFAFRCLLDAEIAYTSN